MTNSKQKLLFDYIQEMDKKLTEKIRYNYYFIILSSFSLVVATFSKDTIPNAYIYAVTTSGLFLFSFLLGLVKNGSEVIPALSFISQIFGLIKFIVADRTMRCSKL